MSMPRFVQFHFLASYPGTLLNRDGDGMAKRLPFGGTTRTRVSSQSLKRHWRFAGESGHEQAQRSPYSLQSLGKPMGDRTKELVERVLIPRATQDTALPDAAKSIVSAALVVALYGNKGGDSKSRQALFFGHPEVDYLVGVTGRLLQLASGHADLASGDKKAADKAAKALTEDVEKFLKDKDLRANMRALADGAGLESALFGRMVTSDPASNKDAPVHVAHAFTVHAMERELDFLTAVDDLRERDDSADAGSAGMFDMELTSGVFYGYVNVDWHLLVANLSGDAELAKRVLQQLMQLMARVSPGAKKGSTAPFTHAEWMMVEAGDDQPRTLANAFRQAVPLKGEGDVIARAMLAVDHHLHQLDAAYGVGTRRAQMNTTPTPVSEVAVKSLAELGDWLGGQLVTAP